MLILVRHGQSESNAAGQLVGRADVPLTELGLEQARRAGRLLAAERRALPDADRPAVRVLTSPLSRARHTAELIATALVSSEGADAIGLPLVEDDLIELDYGDLEGLRPAEVDRAVWSTWRSDPSFTPPGGESFEQLHARLDPLWARLGAEAAAGDVIAVSHVSPIKACVAWAVGAGPELAWRLSLGVGTITRVRTGPGGAALVSFGESSHLVER